MVAIVKAGIQGILISINSSLPQEKIVIFMLRNIGNEPTHLTYFR